MGRVEFKIEIDGYCLNCHAIMAKDTAKMKCRQIDEKTVNFTCSVCRRTFNVLIKKVSVEGGA